MKPLRPSPGAEIVATSDGEGFVYSRRRDPYDLKARARAWRAPKIDDFEVVEDDAPLSPELQDLEDGLVEIQEEYARILVEALKRTGEGAGS